MIERVNNLSNNLQQQALALVLTLREEHLQASGNAWDALRSLTGTVEAPVDWSTEHDHYLYGTPKHQEPKL